MGLFQFISRALLNRRVLQGAAIVCGLLTMAFPVGASSPPPFPLVDATSVQLDTRPVHRIVTLAPSLAEICADLLGDDLSAIVGVSEYTDYPGILTKRPSVGPYHQFNIEKVVALKPDLVLATADGNSKDQVLRLRELGLRVVVVNTESLEGIRMAARITGKLLGKVAEAESWVQRLDRGLAELKLDVRPAPRIMLELGDDPLIVVGRKTFLHEALAAVGMENAFADLDARYPSPAVEEVVKRNPDAIVILSMDGDQKVFRRAQQRWFDLGKHLKAFDGKRIKVMRADPLVRPTLRLLDGLRKLRQELGFASGRSSQVARP